MSHCHLARRRRVPAHRSVARWLVQTLVVPLAPAVRAGARWRTLGNTNRLRAPCGRDRRRSCGSPSCMHRTAAVDARRGRCRIGSSSASARVWGEESVGAERESRCWGRERHVPRESAGGGSDGGQMAWRGGVRADADICYALRCSVHAPTAMHAAGGACC